MKAIYVGVITVKNNFGHICAWYVINTIILLIILNHFCSVQCPYRGIELPTFEIKLEFGVSDSIKNWSLVQFCSKKCSYNTETISDFNKNVVVYVISKHCKILMQIIMVDFCKHNINTERHYSFDEKTANLTLILEMTPKILSDILKAILNNSSLVLPCP